MRKWSRGQGLTEFAIILPVLLLTIFLIVESGRTFQAYVTVQNAAREGARYAVTGQGGENRVRNVKQAAKDILAAGLPLADCDNYWCEDDSEPEGYRIVVWSPAGYDDAGRPGQRVQVQVRYNVRVITPLLSAIARIVPLMGRVEMINEPFGPTALGQSGAPPPPLGTPHVPTPTPKPSITIHPAPLYPGRKEVTGYGHPAGSSQVQVMIYDWLDENSNPLKIPVGAETIQITDPSRYDFRVTLWPGFELLPGHTIRAIADNGAFDDALVLPETGSGSITVQKSVDYGADPTAWTFKLLHPDGFLDILSDVDDTRSDLPLGKYIITESGPDDWHLESVSGAGCTRVGDSVEVVLTSDGQWITCTFTNEPDTGSITVYKSVPEGGDENQWSFTIDGPDGFHQEGLASGTPVTDLRLGSYEISESTVEGWYLDSVQGCTPLSGSSARAEITSNGQSITCTFVNKPYAASIWIEKSTEGLDADLAPGPHILVSDTVTWEYKVTNTGNFTLTNVIVTDNQGVTPSCPVDDTLTVGEVITCNASGTAVAGQYDNIATASGQYLGTPVSDTDPSHYSGVEPPEEGTWRVNCGDDWDYEDGEGNTWDFDPPYSAGDWGYLGDVSRTNRSKGKCNSLTDLLNSYDSGQFFGFQFDNFTPGVYDVTLYFVEPSYSSEGSRRFDVAIEDRLVLDDFDILAQPDSEGNKCTRISRFFDDITVLDDQLNIDLSGVTAADEAIISAIEIQFINIPPVPTPTPLPIDTPVPTQTPLPTPVSLPDLTITGLSVPAGDPVAAWTPVTITTDVFNDSTGPCADSFWTDLYVYTDTVDAPQPSEPGVAWQLLSGLDPYMETTLTFSHTFTLSGTHYLYTQADSFQQISELNENNNVSQPLTMTVFYAGPTPTLTPTPTPDPNCGDISGSVLVFIDGEFRAPGQRVDIELYDGDDLVAATGTDNNGVYFLLCVPVSSNYTLLGMTEKWSVFYLGVATGIEVLADQETPNVNLILYPVY